MPNSFPPVRGSTSLASFSAVRGSASFSSSISTTAEGSSTDHQRPTLGQRRWTVLARQEEHGNDQLCRCDHCGHERHESAFPARGDSPPLLDRTPSRANSTAATVYSQSGAQLTQSRSREKTSKEFLVDFDGPRDPYHPLNWSSSKKISTTLLYAFVTMTATWASSSFSAGEAQVAEEFGVGSEVADLGSSLFLVGFGLGPLLWAPLSEVYGRRLVSTLR